MQEQELPKNVDGLDLICAARPVEWVDRTGRFRWMNGRIVVNFGAKKGTPLDELVNTRNNFLRWILENNFPSDAKDLIRKAMDGVYPVPPEKPAESV